MPASRLAVFFLVSRSAAIFFGGGGCCGCGNSCEPAPARSCPCPPPPPPPTCACQAVVPPSPYGFSAAVPVAAIPGIPPGLNYAVPPPPPLPLPPPPTLVAPPVLPGPISPPLPTNTYSGASVTSSFHQERVPASSFSDEPVPISIERPAQQPRSDSFVPPARRVTKPGLTFKNKADAEDYEILSSSGFRRKPQKRKTINKNPKCVNEQLGRIILKSIKETLSATAAREAISTAAKEMFGYHQTWWNFSRSNHYLTPRRDNPPALPLASQFSNPTQPFADYRDAPFVRAAADKLFCVNNEVTPRSEEEGIFYDHPYTYPGLQLITDRSAVCFVTKFDQKRFDDDLCHNAIRNRIFPAVVPLLRSGSLSSTPNPTHEPSSTYSSPFLRSRQQDLPSAVQISALLRNQCLIKLTTAVRFK